ncbi:MAG TPA: hypothetical protein VK116_01195, partial [Planctomycetota bacterium]|nr:hypothetical protein [Planctomycetota bacterium]
AAPEAKPALCESKALEIALAVRGEACPKKGAEIVLSGIPALGCEKKASEVVALIKAAGCEKSAAQAVLASVAPETKTCDKAATTEATAEKACDKAAATTTEVKADCAKACDKAATTTVAAPACLSSMGEKARSLAKLWEGAASDLTALASVKRGEIISRGKELFAKHPGLQLMPETLESLRTSLAALVGCDAALEALVKAKPELLEGIPEEMVKRFREESALLGELSKLLETAGASIRAAHEKL